ncbi:MAG: DUF1007 family protein, partial [Rhodospirillaceae bacterium]
DGRVAAIEQEWLFDDFYSAFVLDSLRKSKEDRAAGIQGIARENLENLKPYGYFTVVRAGGVPVPAGTVIEFASEVRQKRLWLRFVMPLAAPIDPVAQAMTYSVFDPTYFIEMVHAERGGVRFAGAGADRCSARIDQPRPTPEQIAGAAALDRGARADDSLGQVFAETVVVTCR